MIARKVFLLGFASALLTALGCSSGGDAGTNTPALACSDGGDAAANAVNMNCVGATDGTTEKVNVVMGGPTSGTTTLRGFNFDVTYDPSKLEFVPAASYTSPLFPSSALVVVKLFNGDQGRVVVSIQQVSGVPDVDLGAGQHIVLSLSFRRVAGASFDPTPVEFDPLSSEATAASSAVGFLSGLALSY